MACPWNGARHFFEPKWDSTSMAGLQIQRFCKQLAGKSDDVKRQTLLRLLADEEAELAACIEEIVRTQKSEPAQQMTAPKSREKGRRGQG